MYTIITKPDLKMSRTHSSHPIMPRPRCVTPPQTQEQVERKNSIEEGTAQPPPAPKKISRS